MAENRFAKYATQPQMPAGMEQPSRNRFEQYRSASPEQYAPASGRDAVWDVAKQAGAVGVEAVAGIPGIGGDIGGLYNPRGEQDLAGWIGDKAAHVIHTPIRWLGEGLQKLPTSRDVLDYAGIDLPEPQTQAGATTRKWGPLGAMAIPFVPKIVRGGVMPSISAASKLGVSPRSLRTVARSYKADTSVPGASPNLGGEGMIMDLGPNTRQTARGVWSHPGEGRAVIDEALATRGKGATTRANVTIDRTMGGRQNTVTHAQALKDARKAQGSPLYQQAFKVAGPVNTNAVLAKIDNMIMPGQIGMQNAKPLFPLNDIERKLVRYRSMLEHSGSQRIDGRVLQKVYQDIGDDIGVATRAGRNNEARQLMEVQKELGISIDTATQGQFSAANKQWSTDSDIMEAYETGQGVLSSKVSPDQLREVLHNSPPAAQQQLITGARNQIAEIIGTSRNDAIAARKLLDAGWSREKITLILGKPRADELIRRLDLEKTYAETNNFVRGNSTTGPTLGAMEDVGDGMAGDYGKSLVYGGWMGPVRKAGVDIVEGAFGRATKNLGNRKRADIAKLLSAKGANAARAIQEIDQYLQRLERGGSLTRKALASGAVGAGVYGRDDR